MTTKELLLADREYDISMSWKHLSSSVTTDVEAFTDEMKKACASENSNPEWYDPLIYHSPHFIIYFIIF